MKLVNKITSIFICSLASVSPNTTISEYDRVMGNQSISYDMHSWLSRCGTTTVASYWVCPRGSRQGRACNSNLFTEGSRVVEMKNNWLILLQHYSYLWEATTFYIDKHHLSKAYSFGEQAQDQHGNR